MTNEEQCQEKIRKAYDDGYRNGRLGGTIPAFMPWEFSMYKETSDAWENGHRDGDAVRKKGGDK